MSSQMRGFNAEDARSLVIGSQRSIAEFVVADVLREAEAAARNCRRSLVTCIRLDRMDDTDCAHIVEAIRSRGFEVDLDREDDDATFSLRW
ncbi:MAG: hypothetical protein ABW163_06345 [Luteimonas sp.]